ncbi:ABC transporter ATP-binding protein [Dethiosulfovibrio salsuginis]|uniref:NitT/TauT family transport system ATP-binding protein n=1 Tax=Dethiosulfovibrio salsuginis TaxID=561720 RepID=A0A1X7LDV0_9BACT|nr:ATP-binding cassette domain-containing protein [Dethiosulfovibrio salsuginis]SMG51432.1 NitT/TauT family transport system ATP-binding protein [Dethiosulfovibrio salsuginis]
MTPLLETSNLRKDFKSDHGEVFCALDGVDFKVFDKEFVCLLGPSGCGKSTWLRIVAGLEVATSGSVLYKGSPVKGPGRERGMVFQEYSLLPWRSVVDNVALGPEFNGMRFEDRRELAMDYLARVGLEKFAEAIYLADRIVVMSAHPGRVVETIDVPFDRPRSRSCKGFGEMTERVFELLEGVQV